MIVIIVTNHKAWLQPIFKALICNVSKVRSKDNSHSSQFSWPVRCHSLVCTWNVLTFLCTRQDFSFAWRFEFQGPLANSKTWNQSLGVRNFSDQELQDLSGMDHKQLCPFVLQLLFLPSARRRPGSLQLGLGCDYFCVLVSAFRVYRKNNSGINEMKVSPFSSPMVLGSSTQSPAWQMRWCDAGWSSPLRPRLQSHSPESQTPRKTIDVCCKPKW